LHWYQAFVWGNNLEGYLFEGGRPNGKFTLVVAEVVGSYLHFELFSLLK
jgi:hypothetical protein